MTFSSVTIAGFPFSNAGATKLFLQGGTGPVVKPAAPVYFMELVNFTLPTKGRDEKITFPVPSQLKAGEVVNRTAQAGAYASQTMTLSMYLSADLREGWFDALEESGVVNMWMPISDGTRFLDDPDDFDSGFAVYLATVNSTTPENEANTYSNTDAPLPFNLGVELGYESFSTLVIRKTQPASSDVTLDENVIATGYRSVAGGINWIALRGRADTPPTWAAGIFAVGALAIHSGILYQCIVARTALDTDNPATDTTGWSTYTATDEMGGLVATDANGNWGSLQAIDGLEFTASTQEGANAMVVLGNRAIVLSGDVSSHFVVDVDDVVGASATISASEVTGYDSSGNPNALYAQSPSNIIVVGDGGHIYRLSSILDEPRVVDDAAATTNDLNDVHGFSNQVMSVGASGAVVVSGNNGETWAAATATDGPTGAINCVFMTATDTTWIGAEDGTLYYTEDFGENFTEVTHGTGMTAINDIQFLSLDDGTISGLAYMVGDSSGSANMARTRDNGRSWHKAGSDIGTMPTNSELLSVTIRKANQVIAGGEASADAGIILTS